MTFRTSEFAADGTLAVDCISVEVETRRQKPALTFGTQPRIAIQRRV